MGRASNAFSSLLGLLLRLLQLGVLRFLDLFLHLFGVAQNLLFLLAESLELLLELTAFFLSFRLVQRGLQLFQAIVKILLSASQILQLLRDLTHFLLLCRLLGALLFLSSPLGLIAVLFVVELQSVELLL